mgnify:CR=1 FL=1
MGKLRWVEYVHAGAVADSDARSFDELSHILSCLHRCYVIAALKTTQGGGSPSSIAVDADGENSVPGSKRHINHAHNNKKEEWKHCKTAVLCQLHSTRVTVALERLQLLLVNDTTPCWADIGTELLRTVDLLERHRFQPASAYDDESVVGSGAGDARMRLWAVVLDCLAGLRVCRSSRFNTHDWDSVFQIAGAAIEIARLAAMLQSGRGSVGELEWVKKHMAVHIPLLTKCLPVEGLLPRMAADGQMTHDLLGAGVAAAVEELSKLFTKRRVQMVAVWKVDQTNSSFDLMLRQREATYNQTRLRLVRMYSEVVVRSLDIRAAEELLSYVPSSSSISTQSDALIVRWCIMCYLSVLERVVARVKAMATESAGGAVEMSSAMQVVGGDARAAAPFPILILKKLSNLYAISRVGSGGGSAVRYRVSPEHMGLLQELIVSVLDVCGGSAEPPVPDSENTDCGTADVGFRLVLQGVAKVLNPPCTSPRGSAASVPDEEPPPSSTSDLSMLPDADEASVIETDQPVDVPNRDPASTSSEMLASINVCN